ncbi:MAG TPA: hypothetical protein VF993_06465 [Myxococcales bacterium]
MLRSLALLALALLVAAPALAKRRSKSQPPAETADGGLATPGSQPPGESASDEASIQVVIRHMNGEKETFRTELDSMDLIFDPTGNLDTIHLILLTNGEKDTHRWYQFKNLAAFSYRFLNLSGKGKVRLQMLQPVHLKEGSKGEELPPIGSKDYR